LAARGARAAARAHAADRRDAALANGILEPGMQMVTKPFSMDVFAARIKEMTAS
jgi:hypothetical protein